MQENRETKRLKTVLYNNDNLIYPLSEKDKSHAVRFASSLTIKSFERPDIIAFTPSAALLLEHFSVDAQERSNAPTIKAPDMHVNELVESIAPSGRYITKEAFEENLSHSFDKHIKNTDIYLQHFRHKANKTYDTQLGIIIDSASDPLVIGHTWRKTYMLPFHFASFRNRLRANPRVQHIFYIFKTVRGKERILYMNNNPDSIAALNEMAHLGVFPPGDGVEITLT